MPRPRRPNFNPGDEERPRPGRGGFMVGSIRTFFRLLWVVLIIGGIVWVNRPKQQAPPPALANQGIDAQAELVRKGQAAPGVVADPKGLPNPMELASLASLRKQQLAVAKFNQRQALANFDQLMLAFDSWEKELSAWEKEGLPLLKSDEGKLIGADPVEVKRFRGTIRQERPSRVELVTAKTSAESLIMPIREALENLDDASTPDAGLTESLHSTHVRAMRARDVYREARSAVRAMLAKVKAASPGPPLERTLEEAISALDQEEAGGRAATIDAAKVAAEKEGAEKIAAELARLATEEANNKAAEIANKVAKKKQETELAKAQTIQEMEVAQREAASRIVQLQDTAEKTRIGNLKSGSEWKGSFSYSGYSPGPAKLTIRARSKDDLSGDVTNGVDTIFTFGGKVVGTKLKLKVGQISGFANQTLDLLYQPTTKTITGNMLDTNGRVVASLNVQLFEEKDE